MGAVRQEKKNLNSSLACCQPASADCSEELLRDGIPNDTAAAIATNCFDLIYFSFYNPTTTNPCSSSFLPNVAIQASSFSLCLPLFFIDTYTVCTRDSSNSSSAQCQWQGTSVSRSPCHTVLESG